MAQGFMAAPGTEYGPCADEDCGHDTQCGFARRLLALPCDLCGETIGPDVGYFNATPDDAPVWTVLVHSLCEYERIDREREATT